MTKEFNLSDKREKFNEPLFQGTGYGYREKFVKKFIKQDTKFLDINEICIGFKLSDVVVMAINKVFNDRTRKIAGDKLTNVGNLYRNEDGQIERTGDKLTSSEPKENKNG